MKSLKKLLCILLVLVMSFSMVGCKSKTATTQATTDSQVSTTTESKSDENATAVKQEKVKLKLYAQYTDDSEVLPLDYGIAKMKEIMPEVEVEIIQAARDDDQKLKTFAAAGSLPDIYMAGLNVIQVFKASNNIVQLDAYVKELGVEDQLTSSVKSILRDTDGHIYGVPSDAPWYATLFYNKKIFTENGVTPPTNYDEFLADVKIFKEKGIIPLALFAKEKWPGVQLFDMIATRENPTGIAGLDKTGTALLSDAAYANAAKKVVELVKSGLIDGTAFNAGYDEALAMFTSGQAAMLLNGGWSTADLGPALGEDVGILKYPFADKDKAEAVQYQMSGNGNIGGFAVSPYSENVDIAAKYAILLSFQVSEGRVYERGAIPIVNDSKVEPKVPYTSIQSEYIEFAKNAQTVSAFSWGIADAEIKTILEDNVQKLLTGEYSVENFEADTDKIIVDVRSK